MPAGPRSAAGVLEHALEERPDAEATVARSGHLSYRQLDDLAEESLRALIAAGVRPGDRLGVSLVNDLPLVGLFHAAMRLGAVWVGINPALAPPEKAYLLADSQAAFFAGDRATVEEVRRVSDHHAVRRLLTVDPGTDSEWHGLTGQVSSWRPPVPDPLAPAAIAYTSGTTGFPKGAVHSQHNLMVPGAMIIRARGYDAGLRKADCFPLTILNLQILSTLLVPQCGGTAIVMDRVDPEGIAEWLGRERATVWNGAPAMLYGLATNDSVTPTSLRTLDDVWSGGSHCPRTTKDRFTAKFGLSVTTTYGMTEVPSMVTIAGRGRKDEATSSGSPLPHLAVHIVDPDDRPLAPGTTGEICVGPTADPELSALYRPMLGYWGNEAASASALRHGMLHTGDVGFLDPDGELHVQDRHQSLILRGGANVYPAEVERVINDFPDVVGSCVIGLPDERLGARVAAVVEVRDRTPAAPPFDVEALRAHCRGNIARYKIPEAFVLAPLPRNAMGKVSVPDVRRSLEGLDLDAVGAPGRPGPQ
ncbi:MAG TPA: AMP-binding protein [Acidimicrobiales bacterium]